MNLVLPLSTASASKQERQQPPVQKLGFGVQEGMLRHLHPGCLKPKRTILLSIRGHACGHASLRL